MANNTLAQNGETAYGVNEYVIDSPEDLARLPHCAMGSAAICLSDGTVYMKDSKGQWEEI